MPKRRNKSGAPVAGSMSESSLDGDIKDLIVNSRNEILATMTERFESLESKLNLLTSRVQTIEDKIVAIIMVIW